MSPDFDDLVGNDVEASERERLERVHELLVAAGPPPDLYAVRPIELRPRRRRGAVLAIAAALAVAAFALGAALERPDVDSVVTMDGVGVFAGASVSLTVFELDRRATGRWRSRPEGSCRRQRSTVRSVAHPQRKARSALRQLPHGLRRQCRRAHERPVPLLRVRRLGRRRGGLRDGTAIHVTRPRAQVRD